MITLRDAQYVVAVVDCGHFGRAAEQCFVSQPTLSGQIRKLEGQLSVQLLERHQKRVFLTQAGEALLPTMRQMLLLADEVDQLAANQQDVFAGRLRVGIIPSLAAYIMPYLSQLVSSQYANLEVELAEQQTSVLLEKLHQGKIDMAILALPEELAGLRSFAVWQEQLSLAVGLEHDWLGKQSVSSQQLVQQPLLLLEDGHCLADQTQRLCQLHGNQGAYRGTSLETLRHMVAMGAGVTLVPELTRLQWLQQGENRLHFITIEDPVPARQLGLMCRSSSGRWPLVRSFGESLQQLLPTARQVMQVVPI